jgi:HlyD family secretion protein
MNLSQLPWRAIAAAGAAVYMTVAVLRGVLAPSPTLPTAEDVAQAAREEQPATGTDERFARPQGFRVAGNGVVEPADRETKVSAPVAGRVAAVLVKEGQLVEAGAPLLTLDQELEVAALAAAEADLRAAEADAARTRRGQRGEDIDAARAEADAARARAARSADALARTSALAATGNATPEDLVRAERDAEADRAAAAQADARRRAFVAGSRAEDIDAADARALAARARRDEAQARLDQRTLRAPIGGEILQVLVRPGEFQQPGGADPLVVMGDTRELRVRMDVDERDLGKLKPGDPAVVRAIAAPGVDFPATVVEIGRRMGRKNIRTDDPVERNDTKVLEVVLTLSAPEGLVVGQRVVCYAGKADAEG